METLILEILAELRKDSTLAALGAAVPSAATPASPAQRLAQIIYRQNRGIKDNKLHFAKKQVLPYYLDVKANDPTRWVSWQVDPELEGRLLRWLRVKPRRTASGVATITVITKPWPCSSDCLYCPNDLRMPKSYLSDEPACQRAERSFFDPFLQVSARLQALTEMGHATDKVELIVLGGTYSDYPLGYQFWFMSELLRALNEDSDATREHLAKERIQHYTALGLGNPPDTPTNDLALLQKQVDRGELGYNAAIQAFYANSPAWQQLAAEQQANLAELQAQQQTNERAAHRMVGLVIETRPDLIGSEQLTLLRRQGCTKVQIGIQSLDPQVLAQNNRRTSVSQIAAAFAWLRLFGFKIHAHFMLNLYGATPAADQADYLRLVREPPFQPDEVKLYPCSLVANSALVEHFANGSWRPYTEAELLGLLTADTLATPPFVRISRMVRDISAADIVAGNKRSNLRQLVEARLAASGRPVAEIRYREINDAATDLGALELNTVFYKTTVSTEAFLQWQTATAEADAPPQPAAAPAGEPQPAAAPAGDPQPATAEPRPKSIVAFLRLSLPDPDFVRAHQAELPVRPGEAMIREVHVYGHAARLHTSGEGPQHLGLGRRLIKAAIALAQSHGYSKLNVISSVGTRDYYRALGFTDNGLYQQIHIG